MKTPKAVRLHTVFLACSIFLFTGLLRVVVAVDEEPAQGFLDVYILRHAESMGNVTGIYTEENQRTFSPKGLEQIAGIVDKLKDYHFDHIVVSPTYRTRQTILPYLKAHGRVAEIWPEVEECCCDVRGEAPPAAEIPLGEPVLIEEDEALFFRMREDAPFRFAPTDEREGVAQMFRARDQILKHFGRSGESVLIVSHSCTGSRVVEALLGVKPAGRFSPANAAIIHLRQEPDGRFRLLVFNDQLYEQRYFWRSADGKDAVPNQFIRLALVPRFFAQQSDEAHRVIWQLSDGNRRRIAEGQEIFRSADGGDEEILIVEVPTHGASYGETWALNSRLFIGDRLVHSWQYGLLFPSYVSLAGSWKIKEGDNPAWAATDLEDNEWGSTMVPGAWEADALPGYDGTAWYRLSFEVPDKDRARWGDQPLAVAFGAVDDADETFLNGELIGQSGLFPPEKVTAWDRPRLYVFDSSLLKGRNILAVRVSDWEGMGGIWRGPVAVGPASELRRILGLEE